MEVDEVATTETMPKPEGEMDRVRATLLEMFERYDNFQFAGKHSAEYFKDYPWKKGSLRAQTWGEQDEVSGRTSKSVIREIADKLGLDMKEDFDKIEQRVTPEPSKEAREFWRKS